MRLTANKLFNFFLLLTVFLIPWQTRWIFYTQPVNNQLWEYGQLGLYLSMISLSLAIIFHKKKDSIKWNKYSWSITLVVWLVYLLIISWLSISPTVSLFYFLLIVLSFIFFFLLQQADKTKLLITLVISGTIQALLSGQQFISQHIGANKWLGLAEHWPQTLGTSVIQFDGLRWLRAYGSLPHPNILGGFLLISILAAIWLWFTIYRQAAENGWQRAKQFILPLALVLISLILMTFGLLASFSRGALVALLITLVASLFYTYYRRDKLKIVILLKYLLLLFLIITTFNIFLPHSLWSRWQVSSNRLEAISIQERQTSWQQIDWTSPKQLLFGQGLGMNSLVNLPSDVAPYTVQPIHNYWLLVLGEIGLIGLLIFLYLFWQLIKASRLSVEHSWLLIWVLAGLVDHYWWTSWTGWMLFGIIIVLISSKNSHQY